jgi:hypothetical protein
MRHPQARALTTKQQIQQAKESEFLLGVLCGAYVSKHLIKAGRTDMEKFEVEVLNRVRGKRSSSRGNAVSKVSKEAPASSRSARNGDRRADRPIADDVLALRK